MQKTQLKLTSNELNILLEPARPMLTNLITISQNFISYCAMLNLCHI